MNNPYHGLRRALEAAYADGGHGAFLRGGGEYVPSPFSLLDQIEERHATLLAAVDGLLPMLEAIILENGTNDHHWLIVQATTIRSRLIAALVERQ